MSSNQKKNALTSKINQAAAKAARQAVQSQKFDFDALNRREDAQSQSFRNAEVVAGRAWPFSANG